MVHFYLLQCRPVVPGGKAWDPSVWGYRGCYCTPDFDRLVNPISTKVCRLIPPNSTGAPILAPQIFNPSNGYVSQVNMLIGISMLWGFFFFIL